MSEITYAYAETVVRVSARSVAVTDPFKEDPWPHRTVEGLEVEVATVADDNDKLTVSLASGNRELSATLTPDGRLKSLDYNSVGAGTQVVKGVGKLIAFVGSLALAIGGIGAEGQRDKPARRDADAEWADKFDTEAELLEQYKAMHTAAAKKLRELRAQVIDVTGSAALKALNVQITAVERVMAQAAAEIARIVQLKAAWIEGERTRVTSDIQTVVRFADIAVRTADDSTPPDPPTDGAAGELWRDFGLILEERRARKQTARPVLTDGTPVSSASTAKDIDYASHKTLGKVLWRVPRETELWVWTQGETENDDPVLVSREILWVSDDDPDCKKEGFPLTTSIFGEHGGSLTFGEDGRPLSLRHSQESALAAFVDALAAVPEAVSGGVAAAKTTADNLSALADMKAARALSDAERQLNLAKKKLELAGVEATAADYAALQEAEQAVKLQTARQALEPATPDPLAKLKRELEVVTTENKIAAERRATDLDIDLADVRSELARLELEIRLTRAKDRLTDRSADDASATSDTEDETAGS